MLALLDPPGKPVVGHQAAVVTKWLCAAVPREGWRVRGQPWRRQASASRVGFLSQQAGCCCVKEGRCFSHLCQMLPSDAETLHCNAPSSEAIPSGRMEGGK